MYVKFMQPYHSFGTKAEGKHMLRIIRSLDVARW
jgi:hypothetical protein